MGKKRIRIGGHRYLKNSEGDRCIDGQMNILVSIYADRQIARKIDKIYVYLYICITYISISIDRYIDRYIYNPNKSNNPNNFNNAWQIDRQID